MSKRRLIAAGIALVLAMPLFIGQGAAQEGYFTDWISNDGATAGRELPDISADGRYTVYVARSDVLKGVYVYDRVTDARTNVWAGNAFNPAISGDGQWVAWVVFGGPDAGKVFVLHWQAPGATPELVSLADDGRAATNADFPNLSHDGRFVAFDAMDTDLDDDPRLSMPTGGGPERVYVRDRLLGDTEMVSIADDYEIATGSALMPEISPDGRFVVFAAEAANLDPAPATLLAAPDGRGPGGGGEDGEETEVAFQQIYLRDRTLATTTLVSVDDAGEPGDAASAVAYGPSVSDDGLVVAFDSDATNLVEGDTNEDTDAFVRFLPAGPTIRVSLDAGGLEADLENPVEVDIPWAIERTAVTPGVGARVLVDL